MMFSGAVTPVEWRNVSFSPAQVKSDYHVSGKFVNEHENAENPMKFPSGRCLVDVCSFANI